MKQTPAMDYLNKMIDEAIDSIADDNINLGIEALQELAVVWKSAGMTRQSFVEICQYIQNTASEKSEYGFVEYKMNEAFKKLNEDKIIVGVH